MSSPPESVVSGLPKMWGGKELSDLHARDGKLFQKEIARRLYADMKGVVVDSFLALRESTEGDQVAYAEGLEHCRNWHPLVASEEMRRVNARFKDLQIRLQAVSLLYGRILYSEQCKELGEPSARKSIKMHAPATESLVRGFFSRAALSPWVRNGSFWKMDPFQQDFILREAFRDALAQDCVLVSVQEISAYADNDTGQLSSLSEEVRPDDSVSCLMTAEESAPVPLDAVCGAPKEPEASNTAVEKPTTENANALMCTPSSAEPVCDTIEAGDTKSVVGGAPSLANDKKSLANGAQSVVGGPQSVAGCAQSVADAQSVACAQSVAGGAQSAAGAQSVAESLVSRFTSPPRQPIIVRLGGDAAK